MIHLESVLVYDIPPIVAAVASIAAAKIGSRNHQKLKSIDKAVNGVTNPNEGTIRENVLAIKDEQTAVKAALTQRPPPGQVG